MSKRKLALKYPLIILNTKSFWIALVMFPIIAGAQDKSDLETKRKELEEKMELTNKILADTRKNKSATLDEYKIIVSQIANRENLIANLKQEINESSSKVESITENIVSLDESIGLLRKDYKEIQRVRFRNQMTQNKYLSFFSAKSLQDLFLKWRYTEQFREYAEAKDRKIKDQKSNYINALSDLEALQLEKGKFLKEENSQTLKLSSELKSKNKLLSQLKRNEKKFVANLEKQKTEANELNAAIKNLIKKEIAASKKETPKENKVTVASSTNFNQNKGKLRWPIQDGIVTAKFGKQEHPTVKNIFIENNGIDIKARNNTDVKAVFDGEVRNIFYSEGYAYSIILKHGDFYTLYSNLEQTSVSIGQIVGTGSVLGTLLSKDGSAKAHFEIWRKEKKLNPLSWLSKK